MPNIPLPPPYHDELLYSVIARFFAYMQPSTPFAAYKTVFGRTKVSLRYGRKLAELATSTRLTWAKSTDQIIEEHTLLPFYGHYLPHELYLKCAEEFAVGGNVKGPPQRLVSSTIAEPKRLRFCRSCASNDIFEFGETYWRRVHQLSGVLLCRVHEEILADSDAIVSSNSATWFFQDATTHIRLNSAPDSAELKNREYALARIITSKCGAILEGRDSNWPSWGTSRGYQEAAIQTGYRFGMRRLDLKRLAQDLVSFFQPTLLGKLGFRVPPVGERYFGDMIYGREVYHPLSHAVLQVFFEGTAYALPAIPPLPQASWKCPNPYAGHAQDFRLPKVEIRTTKNKEKYFHARCTCGFAFSFRKTLSCDQLMPVVARISGFGESYEVEARRLYRVRNSIKWVAKSMKAGHQTVKRLIAGRKNRFEPSPEYIQCLRKKWKIAQSKSTYVKLMKYDRVWLLENRTGKNETGGQNKAKPIPIEVDLAMSVRIREAADEIRGKEPPKRVSINAIAKSLAMPNLKIRLRRLPVSLKVLEEVVDPANRRLIARE